MATEFKICKQCNENLEIWNFLFDKRRRKNTSVCNDCRSKQMRNWQIKNTISNSNSTQI